MYLAIDIGGTKTLLGVFRPDGSLQQKLRFETANDYNHFLTDLKENVALLTTKVFLACTAGVPGRLDRQRGLALSYGNLTWPKVSIAADITAIVKAPTVIENDAKLAGLSEALLIKDDFRKVLYLTISTGIGIALIINGVIDNNLGDGGGKALLIEHDGKIRPWEDFASGQAIVKRFGKRAAEINDPAAWTAISGDIAVGLLELIALTQPDVVVIGGGVGSHFAKFGTELKGILKKYETPLLTIPPLKAAVRPEEAVLYGAYALIKTSR